MRESRDDSRAPQALAVAIAPTLVALQTAAAANGSVGVGSLPPRHPHGLQTEALLATGRRQRLCHLGI